MSKKSTSAQAIHGQLSCARFCDEIHRLSSIIKSMRSLTRKTNCSWNGKNSKSIKTTENAERGVEGADNGVRVPRNGGRTAAHWRRKPSTTAPSWGASAPATGAGVSIERSWDEGEGGSWGSTGTRVARSVFRLTGVSLREKEVLQFSERIQALSLYRAWNVRSTVVLDGKDMKRCRLR